MFFGHGVYCLYCNVSGLVVLLLNKSDLILIWFDFWNFSVINKISLTLLQGQSI